MSGYIQCYNFHHYGHIARDCRNKLNNIIECYNCHIYGHIARDCKQRINKVWRRKEQAQVVENNLFREEKVNETCQLILAENDAKRQEVQNLSGTLSKNEVDQCREDGCHMESQV